MKIVINPAYQQLSSFVESIPAIFEKEGTTIYEGRNQLKTYEVDGYDVVVKSFRKPHLINRIAYTFFRPSKARRSYEYAFKLLEKEVDTPDPIAYIEEKTGGLLNRSYYISIFEKKYDHVRWYMTGDIKDDDLLQELARFIAMFHNKGVLFLDMSPGNILQKKEEDHFRFSLIDINRMKFKASISEKERYESFKRLSENAGVITTIAREYAKASGLDEHVAVAEIKKACAQFSKKEL